LIPLKKKKKKKTLFKGYAFLIIDTPAPEEKVNSKGGSLDRG